MNAIIAKTILAASAALAFGMAALPSAAQAGEVGARIGQEQRGINYGVASGQLTYREFANTESRLAQINAQRRFYLRTQGGHLTSWEFRQLNRELNGDAAVIYFDNHNFARQPGAPRI